MPIWYKIHYSKDDIKKLREIADRIAPFMGLHTVKLYDVIRALTLMNSK
jgi:hypothetical protein